MSRSRFLIALSLAVGLAALAPVLLSVSIYFGESTAFIRLNELIAAVFLAVTLIGALSVFAVAALASLARTYPRFLMICPGLPAVGALGLAVPLGASEVLPFFLLFLGALWPAAVAGGALYGEGARARLRLGIWAVLGLTGPAILLLPELLDEENLRLSLGLVGLVDLVMLVVLYRLVPGPGASFRRLAGEAGGAVGAGVAAVGAIWLYAQVAMTSQANDAKALFLARHPEIQVGRPSVILRGDDRYVAALPADGWTYVVMVRDGQLVDDGVAHRKAAGLAREWAVTEGWRHGEITSEQTHSWLDYRITPRACEPPFNGAVTVCLPPAEGSGQPAVVTVYKDRVIRARRPDRPDPLAAVTELLKVDFRDYMRDHVELEIAYAWEHENGIWEYGFQHGYSEYAYAFVKKGQVIGFEVNLDDDRWPPPH